MIMKLDTSKLILENSETDEKQTMFDLGILDEDGCFSLICDKWDADQEIRDLENKLKAKIQELMDKYLPYDQHSNFYDKVGESGDDYFGEDCTFLKTSWFS